MGDQLDVLDRALSAWNRHDLDTYLQLYSPEATVTGYTPEPVGVAGLRQVYETFFAAFPDVTLERVDALEDGQKVAVQFRMSGTHQGDFQGRTCDWTKCRGRGHDDPAVRRPKGR